MNNHDIYIDWELSGPNPYRPLLTRVITAALAAEGVQVPCGVDVLLTTDEGIREINREQRAIDAATDVLSFPMLELTPGVPPDGTGEDQRDPETGLCPLGDMVISVERAQAQAAEFGHSVQREMATPCCICWAMTTWTRAPRRPRCGPGRRPFWRVWGSPGTTGTRTWTPPWRAQGQRRCR